MANFTIKTLLKFGKIDNIKDLYDNGTIYMRPMQCFRETEDGDLRGDKNEGDLRVINSLPGTFKIPNFNEEITYEKVHVSESYDTVLGNIYSLYCISSFTISNPLDFRFDQRIRDFGTHCLLIKDNAYFLKSIENELQRRNLIYKHGFVHYYDRDSVSMNLSVFNKSSKYEFQKEFRFFVQNDKIEPIILKIGALRGKSKIFTTEEILSLKLGYN